MDAQTIQQFKEKLGGYLWTHDYIQFCALLNIDPHTKANEEFWHAAKAAKDALNKIPSRHLAALVAVGGEAEKASA